MIIKETYFNKFSLHKKQIKTLKSDFNDQIEIHKELILVIKEMLLRQCEGKKC